MSLRHPRQLVSEALCKKLNSLAVDQEEHILESYGAKSTSELKRLRESLIDSSNSVLVRAALAFRNLTAPSLGNQKRNLTLSSPHRPWRARPPSRS
jgi:hypothetical protein